MGNPEIIRIEASAGSGKTFHLSSRYLQLVNDILSTPVGGAAFLPAEACRQKQGPKIQPNSISSILAITFTNKAAAEMKERILLTLKEIALKGKMPEGISIPRNIARQALFHLIEHFSDFNVMTIDAFMNTLLKAFAVEANRFPDYELSFNPKQLYTLTLDRLMEGRDKVASSFHSFLEYLLTVERRNGFDPERMIRQTLSKLRYQEKHPDCLTRGPTFSFDEEGEWKEIKTLIADFYTELLQIQRDLGCFNARSMNPVTHLTMLEKREFPNWLINSHRNLESLLKKGLSCPNLPSLEKRLRKIRQRLSTFIVRLEVSRFLRVLEVFHLTQEEEAKVCRELNLFDGSKLSEKVKDLLKGNETSPAPAAFCRLGERYVHYLIDEFQDTSHSQWEGMSPLIENSLSEGGTLFFVGDTKQAIYGWRGGDYTLMRKAYNLIPAIGDDKRRTEQLKINWRSCRTLVDFYNRIFDPDSFDPVLQPIVEDVDCLEDLKDVYRQSQQIPKRGADEGLISVRFLPSSKTEDPVISVEESFLRVLNEARQGYPNQDILILTRRNEEIETIAGWLFEQPEPIPFITEQSLKLFSLPPIKSILNLLSYLSFPQGEPFLHALVHDRLFNNLTIEKVEEILNRYPFGIPFENFFRTTFPELDAQYLAPLRDSANRLSPYELTQEVISHFQIPKKFPGSLPLLDRLLEQVLLQEQKGGFNLAEMVKGFYESEGETELILPETPNALRLMTIHKAKGLEASVVILPFANWSMKPRNYQEIFKVDPSRNLCANLSRRLCKHLPIAEERKREIFKRNFIENFNLFYVAVTRAKEALYVLVPSKEAGGQTIGNIFSRLCTHHGYMRKNGSGFRLGSLRPQKGKKKVREEPAVSGKIPSLLRGNIRVSLRLAPEVSEETWMDARARRLGNIAHTALGTIDILPPTFSPQVTAHQALLRALRRMGLSLHPTIIESLLKMLTSTIQDLSEYFTAVDRAWSEKELVSREGEIIRIDRLVRKEGKLHILEFKTGREEETHIVQVRRYLRIVRELGATQHADGILYYLETGVIRHV